VAALSTKKATVQGYLIIDREGVNQTKTSNRRKIRGKKEKDRSPAE